MSLFGSKRPSRVLGAALAAWLGAVAVAACSKGETPEPAPLDFPSTPASAALRRLLARQYKNSVGYLLGPAAAAAATPPEDTELNGFASIAMSQLSLNDTLVARYESSARSVAEAAMKDSARIAALAGCKPASADDKACFRSFVANFGRLAWRRPLSAEELDDYVAVAAKAAQQKNDFNAGVQYAITALLQSPNFLYQVEIGAPVPDRPDLRRLGGFEVATRMSFLLLDRTPDKELIDAAERGELESGDGVRAWAEKLLAEPDAKSAMREFFSELFVLDDLTTIAKDPALFPDFSPDLAASMREEALRLVDQMIAGDAPFTSLLTTKQTFVDDRLAAFYGVAKPAAPWQAVTLPAEQGRVGILTTAAVMARQAHATSTSATRRGLFVMERFMCTTMPPPPPDVVTTLPPPSSTAPTLRDRIKVHQTTPVCRSCHYQSDNIGLTFEHYDGIGRYRAKEGGATIDASGTVAGMGSWKDPNELAAILSQSPLVKSCVVREVYRYATGHVEVDDEWPAINDINARWAAGGYRFRALLVELVASDLFRHVGALK